MRPAAGCRCGLRVHWLFAWPAPIDIALSELADGAVVRVVVLRREVLLDLVVAQADVGIG